MSDRLSRHFRRAEFACRCGCGFDTIDHATLEILEAVRVAFDAAVVVTSAARCPAHNAAVGGASNSQHLYGRAADIQVRGHEPVDVYSWIKRRYPHASLGLYRSFVHVDTRTGGPARWKRYA